MIKVQDMTDGEIGYATRNELDSSERYVWVTQSENGSTGQYILRSNLKEV